MFNSKKKIEFNNEELRIVLYALNDFRNKLLSENKKHILDFYYHQNQ